MILGKIIFTILIGLLLSLGLWVVCYILSAKMYPRYSLQMRHHLFSLLVAVVTFVLYCSFSTVSATISGIKYASDSAKEIVMKGNDIADNLGTGNLSIKEKSKDAENVIDAYAKNTLKKLNVTWWGLLLSMIIIQLIYFGTMINRAEKKSRRNRTNRSVNTSKTIKKHYRT